MKYSGHRKLLCKLSKCYAFPRIQYRHWCIFSSDTIRTLMHLFLGYNTDTDASFPRIQYGHWCIFSSHTIRTLMHLFLGYNTDTNASFPRIQYGHWCIFSSHTIRTLMNLFLFTNSANREDWFQFVRRVYATAINFLCIITMVETTLRITLMFFF